MTLHILEPGLYTLVVDHGRPRTRSLGVPVGGAADRFSLAIGNTLVSNPAHTPALEISLAGPTLTSDCDLACVLFGSPFEMTSDRQALTTGKTFTLHAGERLRIGGAIEGMRAYFCVRGGVETPVILGSHSGLEPLRTGDELPCQPGVIDHRWIQLPPEEEPGVLRVLDGAQASWFEGRPFYDQDYRVTPSSNRMGLRLAGEPLPFSQREMVSEPVCPGTVQVTRDGQCIVLGVDGQTIGGYPKIAQVISADLDRVGQLRPGERVRFRRVSLGEAEALYQRRQTALRRWVLRLHPH